MTPVLVVCVAAIAVAFVTALVRVARGPSPADRATGSDVSYQAVVSCLAIAAVLLGDELFVDVALVGGVVGFLATISFAWLVQRKAS